MCCFSRGFSNSDINVKDLNVELKFPVVLNKKTILLTILFDSKTRSGLDCQCT